ncbi:glycosyltransferase [Gaeumannomyces tritici R3-111a-1]|uniref:Glycosyltransferase n=1 Tax=Gaeumannomyces tritici (strain R3-111a-1) TaxID=644352 RepID=J3NW08_GAET3|nr:glycosyltransferase [Gaeumannomyces tritici R3-111a-1]EJT75538.1 glycosyltransferase [Gaeumannomyces tritici R3-111a-1]
MRTDPGTAVAAPPPPRTSRRPLRFLIHTFSATGHVLPAQAVAQELVRRGHSVVWATAPAQRARVAASGARFVPTRRCAAVDARMERPVAEEATTPDDGAAARQLFAGRVEAQVADLRDALQALSAEDDWRPDYVLNDAMPHGVAALAELGELPPTYATLGVVPLYIPDVMGDGRPVAHPARSTFGALLSTPRLALPVVNPQRAALGLPPLGERDAFAYSPALHLQASCPSLEHCAPPPAEQPPALFPGAARQPRVHFVGPLVPRPLPPASSGSSSSSSSNSPSLSGDLPAWWGEMCAHGCVVGVTQGTYAVDPTALIVPAVRALRGGRVLVVVVHGSADEVLRAVEESDGDGGGRLDNVRAAPWIPYDLLLPRCRALVTNGGYGSVTQALAHGVPLVCAGASEDKPDTAARVVAVGAGVDLGTDRPSVEQVRDAVREVIEGSSYRERAAAIAKELNSLGGAAGACDLLVEAAEELVGDGRDAMVEGK